MENNQAPETEQDINRDDKTLPLGIARIRQEWRAAGLSEQPLSREKTEEAEGVVFPEVEGGAGIGDYTLDVETVKSMLALSPEAVTRLVASGEIDSILVQGPDGRKRRLFSEASVNRFEVDSAIDPNAVSRAARQMTEAGMTEAIDDLRAEVEELRNTQGKILQQMKDMLLLEVRNLKEQDRDLTSFVYELAEEIREAMGQKKQKK